MYQQYHHYYDHVYNCDIYCLNQNYHHQYHRLIYKWKMIYYIYIIYNYAGLSNICHNYTHDYNNDGIVDTRYIYICNI